MDAAEKERRCKSKTFPSALKALSQPLRTADVLLIVPPFCPLESPCLAIHLLKACGQAAGISVEILYASFLLASMIGEKSYTKICDAPIGSFAGDRFFARHAFGNPRLGRRAIRMFEPDWILGPNRDWVVRPDYDCHDCREPITLQELRRLELHADGFLNSVAEAVGKERYPVVGCSATFEQTVASIALLKRIKLLCKDTITILGGANCEGDMARGIASLESGVDYIFSGESEVAFTGFVRTVLGGVRPRTRIIAGKRCRNMDALPAPSYDDFYEQRERLLYARRMPPRDTKVYYQTSRGCWWGQKHPCTFCGIDEERVEFREKSPDRVVRDLKILLGTNPGRQVVMTDDVMPYRYFHSLLPRLRREFRGVSFFYELRPDLSLRQIMALKQAGITAIQCGIESLSTRLLRLMNKGVNARQNLMLLRNARAARVEITWHLLWGIPGDEAKAYEETLAMLPLLHHFQPPAAMLHLSIERFSRYYRRPAEFGIRKIRPLAGYYDVFPRGAEIERIACHFTAQYQSGAHDHVELIADVWQEMSRWQAAWRRNGSSRREDLKLHRRRGVYVLVDTRDLGSKKRRYTLNERDASALVSSGPYLRSEIETWAIQEKLAVVLDGWFVPLAVASPEILLELMKERTPE